MSGLTLPFSQTIRTDVDAFSVNNQLNPDQADDSVGPIASVVGLSAFFNGVHGVNGNGSGSVPPVGTGVWGESDNGFGVYGSSDSNSGVQGVSAGFDGVHGESQSPQHSGVNGINNNGGGPGVSGSSASGAGVTGFRFRWRPGVSGNSDVGTGVSRYWRPFGIFARSVLAASP